MDSKKLMNSNCHMERSMMHPERFSYWYTGMGTQILAPKKENIPFFILIFSIAGYVFSLFSSTKTYFIPCKPI